MKKINIGDYVSFRSASNSAIFCGRVCEIESAILDGVETKKYFIYIHMSGDVLAVPEKRLVF